MNEPSLIKIILADDHELLRDGLRALLEKVKEVKLVAEASNGKELCDAVEIFLPDIVITDIKMPVMDGLDATKLIRKKFPQVKIIALSNYDEENLIADMINAGADGYLLKNTGKKELLEAINTIQAGRIYYCNATSKKLLNHLSESNTKHPKKEIKFTNRELEVLKLICKGMTNKEIGKHLGISARTVETHKEAIQDKTGLKSAVSIALFALENKFI